LGCENHFINGILGEEAEAEQQNPPVPVYTISTEAGPVGGGRIGASLDSAPEGTMITLTVQPETGYRLKADSVTANGGAVPVTEHTEAVFVTGAVFTFVMPAADVTASVEFEPLPAGTYTVFINSSIGNGRVAPNRVNAETGVSIVLSITPEAGYCLKENSLTVNDGAVEVNEQLPGLVYTFVMPVGDVTVNAEFEAIPLGTFAITAAETAHGKIIPAGFSAAPGDTMGLAVMPDPGYQLKEGALAANGGAVPLTPVVPGSVYAFFMPPLAVHLTAEFELIPAGVYTVKVSEDLANGFIVPSLFGASEQRVVNFYVTPDAGYRLVEGTVQVNGGAVPVTEIPLDIYVTGAAYSFIMPAFDVTIGAEFEKLPSSPPSSPPSPPLPSVSYTITVSAMTNGSVRAGETSTGAAITAATAGKTVWLIIEPAGGYRLKDLLVTRSDNNSAVTVYGSGSICTFAMPAANVTVSAGFEPIPPPATYTITISAMTNGSVRASETGTGAAITGALSGKTLWLVIEPDSGYRLKNLLVTRGDDNSAVTVYGSGSSRTFAMPAANITVAAEFEPIPASPPPVPYIITISAVTNGSVRASATSTGAAIADALRGATVWLVIEPDSGYRLKADSLRVTRNDDNSAVTVYSNAFIMPPAAVTVSAEFEAIPAPVTCTITISAVTNGSVRASATSTGPAITAALSGSSVWLVIEPAGGYRLKADSLQVTRDDDSSAVRVSSSYTSHIFTMPESNVTVDAEFEPIPTYAITVGATTNGSIRANDSAGGTVITASASGKTVWLVIAPDSGYRLKADSLRVTRSDDNSAVTVSGSGLSYRYFTMPAAAVTVAAEFELIPTYTITIGATTNGSIRASDTSGGTAITAALSGKTVYLVITPDSGYRLKADSIQVERSDDNSAVSASGSAATYRYFTMPESAVAVDAEFELIPYSITVTLSGNGTVSPGAATATAGTAVTLTVQPETGYRLKAGSLQVRQTGNNSAVTLTGAGQGPYAFAMPAAAVTVSAEFEVIIPPGSRDITLNFTDPGQGAFSQTSFAINKSGSPNPVSQTISLAGIWDTNPAPRWDIDNGRRVTTGNSVTVNAGDLNAGGHSLTVTVYKNGVPWSGTLDFTVGN
jgi:predicted small integral membrane protein